MGERTAEVTIRPTRAGDEPFVVALGERAFAIYSFDARSTMRSILSDEMAHAAIAEIDGARVGFVIARVERYRPFGPWQRPSIVRVDAIAVHPDWQKRGVGARLMGWVDDLAAARRAWPSASTPPSPTPRPARSSPPRASSSSRASVRSTPAVVARSR